MHSKYSDQPGHLGQNLHNDGSINEYKQTYKEHSKHGLCYIEGMSPVVICDRSVIFLHTARPPTYYLKMDNNWLVDATTIF